MGGRGGDALNTVCTCVPPVTPDCLLSCVVGGLLAVEH